LTQTASAKICYRNAKSAGFPSGCRKTEAEKRIKALKEHSALSAPSHTTGEANAPFDFPHAASVLTDAAARAGAAIMQHYHEGPEVSLKADASPVTAADRAAEAILLEALKSLAPLIPIVSEEDAGDRSKPLPSRFFLVDPLDGTKEFIQKRTDFTVNVALIEDCIPRFGLVYAPARKLLAVTVGNGKAVEAVLEPSTTGADLGKLERHELRVRIPSPKGLVAVVSRSHLDPETESFLSGLKIASWSDAGSSLKFLLVASGQADVYPRFGPTMEWDIAAGDAVLRAAGGRVVDGSGQPFRYGKTDSGLKNASFIAWGSG
jgi:3'(2'), 5'-bisphosphate nucleotidase